MFTDSHCHLTFPELVANLPAIRQSMADAQVDRALCICTTLEEFPDVHRLATQYDNFWSSVGVHPDNEGVTEPTLDDLLQRGQLPRVVAIGETGLDYYRLGDRTLADMHWQRERFRTHIRAARQLQKPLVIHTRSASEDTLAILREEGEDGSAGSAGGVFHCFTESQEVARQALELGFYISFSGILTFKTAQDLRDVATWVPMDRLLIETDSPYLAPVPYRGKTNNPSYVPYGQATGGIERLQCGSGCRGHHPEFRSAIFWGSFMRIYFRFVAYLIVLFGVSASYAGSYDDFFGAIQRDDAAVVRNLLARGFDPNTVNPKGDYALIVALREPSLKVVAALLEDPRTRAEVRTTKDESPLMLAALRGYLDVCKLLIARDADVNKPGWTPLHYAATGGHIDVMRLLLDNHAYIDAASPNGSTPLMMASMYGTIDSVKLLLEAGADPSLKNVQGLSAIDFARQVQREETVLLVAAALRSRKPKGVW
jgi:TatD DNase family protein